MAITLKYGAPGPILAAGFASGVGSRKNKQQDDLLKIWQQQTQQNFQGQQANIDRMQRFGLQQQAQAFQANQQGVQNKFNLAFRDDQQKFAAEQNRLQRNAMDVRDAADRFQRAGDREEDRAARKAEFEAVQDQNRMRGLASRELELPAAAQREMDQLEEGLIAAGKLEPAQQEEYRQKYEKRARELRGFARPAAKSPEEVQWDHEQAKMGHQESLKQKAEQEKQQQATAEAAQKQQQTIIADAKKMFSEKNDDGTPKYKSFGEALQAADAQHREAAAFFVPPAAPPQPGQQKWGDVVPPQQAQTGAPAAPPPQQAVDPLDAIIEEDIQSRQPGAGRDAAEADLQMKGVKPWDANGIQTTLKKYPDLPPEIAKGITPELVQKATDQGAKDPIKAAIVYQSLISQGSLTSADKSQQTWYQPEQRKAILENSQLPKPQSAEEMNALPKGAAFVAPDGTIRRKP